MKYVSDCVCCLVENKGLFLPRPRILHWRLVCDHVEKLIFGAERDEKEHIKSNFEKLEAK